MPYQTFRLPVRGGELHGAQWGRSGPVLLCSHGITGNLLSFELFAEALGKGFRVVAVDHRGRGRSNAIPGPWGMREHAADMVAVLDHLGIARADVVVGQSMGGFVAAVLAAQHPDRVGPVLMVDGGLPLIESLPWFVPVNLLVRAMLGPAVKRLGMRFESREAYQDYWRRHPALARDWSAALERYVDYDLVGEPPELRSSVRVECVFGDAQSQLAGRLLPDSLQAMRGPVRLLRAPRGIMDGKPIYAERLVRRWRGRIRGFSDTVVPDVNHYTIMLSERGARAVADEARRLL